jgi:hypothetical protein
MLGLTRRGEHTTGSSAGNSTDPAAGRSVQRGVSLAPADAKRLASMKAVSHAVQGRVARIRETGEQMPGQMTSPRAEARRRAREVRERRKAQAEVREERICALLARYFESAEHTARYQVRAAQAVSDLLQVAGTISDVACLCGISVTAVRHLTSIAAAEAGDGAGGDEPQAGTAGKVPGRAVRPAGEP